MLFEEQIPKMLHSSESEQPREQHWQEPRQPFCTHFLTLTHLLQELVTRAKARRWKVLGLVIAAAITVAVVATVLVLVLRKPAETPQGEPLTLDDILARRFTPRQFNASWISGNCHQRALWLPLGPSKRANALMARWHAFIWGWAKHAGQRPGAQTTPIKAVKLFPSY